MPEYRQVAFEHHGRECDDCGATHGIEVHHIDGDRTNNNPENLLPLCRHCHSQLHRSGLNGLEDELLPPEERPHIDQGKTTFQISEPCRKWQAWKNTVPRSKSLEQRINELIRADTEGRVVDVDLDAVRADLERALEHQEWGAVEDALARLENGDV